MTRVLVLVHVNEAAHLEARIGELKGNYEHEFATRSKMSLASNSFVQLYRVWHVVSWPNRVPASCELAD